MQAAGLYCHCASNALPIAQDTFLTSGLDWWLLAHVKIDLTEIGGASNPAEKCREPDLVVR